MNLNHWLGALASIYPLACAAGEPMSSIPKDDGALTAADSGTESPTEPAPAPTTFLPDPTPTYTALPEDPPSVPPDSCTAVEQQAEAAVQGAADVIILVDTSGSMLDEIAAVKANLGRFAQQIVDGGVDVHVILIAHNSVCIDAPLGSGACGGLEKLANDTNQPRYTHVNQAIGSTDALLRLQDRLPDWLGLLRPEAQKHVFVVTDDNSSLTAAEFSTWMQSVRLLVEPSLTVSGMFCAQNVGNCASAGVVYTSLVLQTSGVAGDLSQLSNVVALNAEFDRVFAEFADVLISEAAPVDCEWAIPEPPDGETLDKSAVNLRYTASTGEEKTIPAVATLADCDAELGGWHYDDPSNPTRVVACSATCTEIQSDAHAKIDLLFGCATVQLIR